MKRLLKPQYAATLYTAVPTLAGVLSLLALLESTTLWGLLFIPGALLLIGPAISYWRGEITKTLEERE